MACCGPRKKIQFFTCASCARIMEEDEIKVRASVLKIPFYFCGQDCWIHFLRTFNDRENGHVQFRILKMIIKGKMSDAVLAQLRKELRHETQERVTIEGSPRSAANQLIRHLKAGNILDAYGNVICHDKTDLEIEALTHFSDSETHSSSKHAAPHH